MHKYFLKVHTVFMHSFIKSKSLRRRVDLKSIVGCPHAKEPSSPPRAPVTYLIQTRLCIQANELARIVNATNFEFQSFVVPFLLPWHEWDSLSRTDSTLFMKTATYSTFISRKDPVSYEDNTGRISLSITCGGDDGDVFKHDTGALKRFFSSEELLRYMGGCLFIFGGVRRKSITYRFFGFVLLPHIHVINTDRQG